MGSGRRGVLRPESAGLGQAGIDLVFWQPPCRSGGRAEGRGSYRSIILSRTLPIGAVAVTVTGMALWA
jgi:hypothetical protein